MAAPAAITDEDVRGAPVNDTLAHPLRYPFGRQPLGMSLRIHRRTGSEADIVDFACIGCGCLEMHCDEAAWGAEVRNPHGEAKAPYDLLRLVAKRARRLDHRD